MDDCEDGNHARVGDDCLLHISLDARADIAGSVARRGITNRNTQSTRYHRFNRDLLSSGVLRRYRYLLSAPALFHRGVCAAGAHCRRKALFVSGYFSSLRPLPSRCDSLLFLVATEDDSFFLSRYRVTRLVPHLDRATILFLCDPLYDRLRTSFRTTSGGAGAGSIWIDYLQVHGAHTPLCRGADLYSGDDHYADTRHSDFDRDGAPDVSAL